MDIYLYLMENYPMLVGSLIIGLVMGILMGLFGAGGFIVAPALHFFLGLPMNMAVGTSSFQVFGASFISLCRHLDRRFIGIRVAIWVGLGVPPGVFLGTLLVGHLTEMASITIHGHEFVAVNLVLSLIFVVFLLAIFCWLFIDNYIRTQRGESDLRAGLLTHLRIPPMITFKTIPAGAFSGSVLAVIGVFIGFLAGLLGIGGGVIMMPVLHYLAGQNTKDAVRTGIMLVFASSLLAAIGHGMNGNVNYVIALFLIIGAFAGTRVGLVIHHRISDHALRRYFTFVVLSAAVMVIVSLLLKGTVGR